jgi:hypothetical protein
MTKIILQALYSSDAVEQLELVDWMSLTHTLTHPRFARLQRVEIIVWIPDFDGTRSPADKWVNKVRTEMGVLDSRGCLFVSMHWHNTNYHSLRWALA